VRAELGWHGKPWVEMLGVTEQILTLAFLEGKCNVELLPRFVFKLPLGFIRARLKTIRKFFLPCRFDWASASDFLK